MSEPAISICDACQALLERELKNNPFATYYCEHNQALAVAVIVDGRLSGYRMLGPCTTEEAAQIIAQGIQQGVDRHDADHSTKQ